MALMPTRTAFGSQLTLPKLNTANLSTGLAMLLPIARPDREGLLWSGLQSIDLAINYQLYLSITTHQH